MRLSRRAVLKTGVCRNGANVVVRDVERGGRRRQGRRESGSRFAGGVIRRFRWTSYARSAAQIGLAGVDLLQPEEYEIPRRHGLICTMGYAGGGEIAEALNRTEHHAAIEAGLRMNIPLAAKAGVPNVITFSGNRRGMTDEEGARNTVVG